MPPTNLPTDELYGKLHSARERLCSAQVQLPTEDSATLSKAVYAIDQVGQKLPQWSRYNRAEHCRQDVYVFATVVLVALGLGLLAGLALAALV
jgi:hypothetical protein